MAQLYRSMQAAHDGLPARGPSSRCLGARPGIDIPVDAMGNVEPGLGGMSVSPDDPTNLPEHRRPPEHGGSGKDPVWGVGEESLGSRLVYRPDPEMPDRHGFVEPHERMSFAEYTEAIAATALHWRRVGG